MDANIDASGSAVGPRAPFMLGSWLVEPAWHRVSEGGVSRKVEPRVMRLLCVLASSPGRPITRAQLLDTIWPDVAVNEDALSRAVSQLRAALGDDPRQPRYIETVHKGGYCLVAPVREAGKRPEAVEPAERAPRPARRGLVAAALLALAAASAGALWISSDGRADRPAPVAAVPLVPKPVTSEPGREIDPAISPDGRRVAFGASGGTGYDLVLKTIGADGPVKLTSDGSFAGHPAWSPTGDRIAFVRRLGGRTAIWIASVPTGRISKLMDLHSWSGGLDWSPDGEVIVFSDGAADGVREIQLLDVRSGVRRTISRTLGPVGDGDPAFSPDGRYVAVVRDAGLGLSRILLLDLADLTGRFLVQQPERIMGLAWNAAGSGIIYSALAGRRFRLRSIALAGGVPRTLPVDGGDLVNPSVARDGRLVAEALERSSDIWTAAISGAGASPLIRSTADDDEAALSPDGRRIAFVSARSGAPELWISAASGADPRQATSLMGRELGAPIWSPDGKKIAFYTQVEGYAAVQILDLPSARRFALKGERGTQQMPIGWGETSRSLFVAFGSGADWRVRRYDIATGRAAPVSPVPARLATTSGDGRLLYLLSDEGELTRIELESGRSKTFRMPAALAAAGGMRGAGAGLYIFVPGASGTTVFRVADSGGAAQRVGIVPTRGRISVSPDERRLLFGNERETGNDIVTLQLPVG